MQDPNNESTPLMGNDLKKPLRGEKRIDAFLALVGLSAADADRPSGTYSGGMKRKLSVACTLITDPQLLFLDEMSAGVDIVAQRTLWRLLVQRPRGQTIVSTTHSMLEADSTCDRIGILVSGKLRCLGDSARLKRMYGAGHHLELTVDSSKLVQPDQPSGVPVFGQEDPVKKQV